MAEPTLEKLLLKALRRSMLSQHATRYTFRNTQLRRNLICGGPMTHGAQRFPDAASERWRAIYNTVRPHSGLGYRPPAPEVILSRAPFAADRSHPAGSAQVTTVTMHQNSIQTTSWTRVKVARQSG